MTDNAQSNPNSDNNGNANGDTKDYITKAELDTLKAELLNGVNSAVTSHLKRANFLTSETLEEKLAGLNKKTDDKPKSDLETRFANMEKLLQSTQAEREEAIKRAESFAVRSAIVGELSKHPFQNPEVVLRAMDKPKFDAATGEVYYEGQPGNDGNPTHLPVSEAVEKFAKENPWALKANNSGGAGTKGGGLSPNIESQLKSYADELNSLTRGPETAARRAELESKIEAGLREVNR